MECGTAPACSASVGALTLGPRPDKASKAMPLTPLQTHKASEGGLRHTVQDTTALAQPAPG